MGAPFDPPAPYVAAQPRVSTPLFFWIRWLMEQPDLFGLSFCDGGHDGVTLFPNGSGSVSASLVRRVARGLVKCVICGKETKR